MKFLTHILPVLWLFSTVSHLLDKEYNTATLTSLLVVYSIQDLYREYYADSI